MKKLRTGLIWFAIGLIALVLIGYFNYDDLSWSANKSNYIPIISMVCVIIAMIGSNRVEAKSESKQ